MKYKRILAVIMIAASLITGCGAKEVTPEEPKSNIDKITDMMAERNRQGVVEEPVEEIPETEEEALAEVTEEESSEEESTLEEEIQESDEKAPEATEEKSKAPEEKPKAYNGEGDILVFRDAFGEEYETTINPDITKNPYDKSAFYHNGSKLDYAGGDYMLGVDVSKHQGDIDWKKVAADGYEFAIIRIGYRGYGKEGRLSRDELFEQNYKGATDAGLKVGVYFFAQAINETEASDEANYVLETLKGRDLDLPVVYDPETIKDDEARTDNVSGEQFTKNARVFCKTIKDAGYDPMIYANMLWEAFELDLTKLSEYPIWYADYEEVPQTPYDFDMWQYTNEGIVQGISGLCDINIYMRRV